MATKQEIINDIRKNYGNMLNVAQAAKVFSCDRKTVRRYLAGLDVYQFGKEKKYLAIDIGRRIYNMLISS